MINNPVFTRINIPEKPWPFPVSYREITSQNPGRSGKIRKIFINAAAQGGIERKIETHLLRKSRGTHLIELGLPLANIIEMMWANRGPG